MDARKGEILKITEHEWKLGICIGRGTCSEVFEAAGTLCYKRGRKRAVKGAVKVFKEGSQFEQAALNEIKILQYLCHESESLDVYYFVNLLDYFLYRGNFYLVFEQLDCHLHHILLKYSGKGLPISIVRRCSKDVVKALSFLAIKRVVHGDLKMSNIMWNPNRGIFQLVDFGLSFLEGHLQPSQPLQSPGYQSPEVQMWNRLVPHGTTENSMSKCLFACDMWSFSYVLWYMYTGHSAPRHELHEPVCTMCLQEKDCMHFQQIQKELPQDEREITLEQHNFFLDFVMRMMKCKPEQRITPFNAMQHSFLNEGSTWNVPLGLTELLLLPTRILQLTNILLEDLSTDLQFDGLMDVKEECAKFGAVKGFKFTGDSNTGYKVFVEFSNADDCSRAHSALTGRDFNGRTVITSFYPIDYYHIDCFWC